MNEIAEQKSPQLLINIISVLIPLAIVLMLAFPNKVDLGAWTKTLPHVVGTINSLTTIALILGLVFIKLGNISLHRIAMSAAFLLGVCFLFCYVGYHISNPANKFSGVGASKVIYLLILASHILMSLVVLPLVLIFLWLILTSFSFCCKDNHFLSFEA